LHIKRSDRRFNFKYIDSDWRVCIDEDSLSTGTGWYRQSDWLCRWSTRLQPCWPCWSPPWRTCYRVICFQSFVFRFYRAALNAGPSSYEKGVRLSVCRSNACTVTKR